jgi:hypothetical protein
MPTKGQGGAGTASMTDARVNDPARGDWARCTPLVATPPVFPGPGRYGLTAHFPRERWGQRILAAHPRTLVDCLLSHCYSDEHVETEK